MALKKIYLKDYQPHPFAIKKAKLCYELSPRSTIVSSELEVSRNPLSEDQTDELVLDGVNLKLVSIHLNDVALSESDYQVDDEKLIIKNIDEECNLKILVEISPETNKALSGLYMSNGNFCTQCESHGFRRMTYFIDRPDNLCQFTTQIIADNTKYPVVLGNGNCVEEKIDGGKAFVTWDDPTLKPCYLFALVAGDFESIHSDFKTMTDRNVKLGIYVEKGKLDQANFAMVSLQKAMAWDEQKYGCVYDLDVYNVVGVSDFNYGAMENKGLNIFNTSYMLANPKTATDNDYINILGVIGHEYFHNWSGNRITLKNWFQLSLKEGLTVFRDQHFTADMTDPVVKRIHDVNIIKNYQFAEDQGPMSHPVRPHAYVSMNNFYTSTVYNKGAEVIRMIKTLLGADKFRQGMDYYFKNNDGQAVTIDEFVSAMEWAGGIDLSQFKRWYDQSGTPLVSIEKEYSEANKSLVIKCRQKTTTIGDKTPKEPFVIPLVIGFINGEGEFTFESSHIEQREDNYILHLTQDEQEFVFNQVDTNPILSINRAFSAPIKVNYPYSLEDYIEIIAHDTDLYNRWDSVQSYIKKQIIDNYHNQSTAEINSNFIQALSKSMNELLKHGQLVSSMLSPMSARQMLQEYPGLDIISLDQCISSFYDTLAEKLHQDFSSIFKQHHEFSDEEYCYPDISRRAIQSIALYYLVRADKSYEVALNYYADTDLMTNKIAALRALNEHDVPEKDTCLMDFYNTFKDDQLVIDKWLMLNATTKDKSIFKRVNDLMSHKAYNPQNPNNVRALIGAYASTVAFHREYSKTYPWLTEQILKIDAFNAQLAARLTSVFVYLNQFDTDRKENMIQQLETLQSKSKSKDIQEVVASALNTVSG